MGLEPRGDAMNHLSIIANDFADRISATLWNASDALKKGENPKQVAEILEHMARELDAFRIELQLGSEMEDLLE